MWERRVGQIGTPTVIQSEKTLFDGLWYYCRALVLSRWYSPYGADLDDSPHAMRVYLVVKHCDCDDMMSDTFVVTFSDSNGDGYHMLVTKGHSYRSMS